MSLAARLLSSHRQATRLRLYKQSAAALSTKMYQDSSLPPSPAFAPFFVLAACAYSAANASADMGTANEAKPKDQEKKPTNMEDAAKGIKDRIDQTLFDASSQWEEEKGKGSEFFKSLIMPESSGSSKPIKSSESMSDRLLKWFGGKRASDEPKSNSKGTDFGAFYKLVSGGGGSNSFDEVFTKAREIVQDDVQASSSLTDVVEAASAALKTLKKTTTDFFGDADPPQLHPPNVHYWIEHEENRKNSGWKRRKHRFCTPLDIQRVEELDHKLHFANLCYADTLQEIQEELEETFGYKLLYCSMDSQANQPSHFIAVKRDQSAWSNALEVTMVVRGTKTITDVITDILCEEAEYRGGTAHAGMLESGRYLSEKHEPFFKRLCKLSGKSRINLTIIGHSLGAGAATIAGMELNDKNYIDVKVFGFGAPATLSKKLSETTKGYVTTVIADNDCVPRMSAATMLNAVMDMSEYNWVPSGLRDIKDAISIAYDSLPAMLRGNKDKAFESIEKLVKSHVQIPEPTTKRMVPTLFPPGEVIHFYRDGFGVSAVVTPCDFFNELDVNWRMVDDHLYYSGYKQIFLELMRHHRQDHFFEFETDRLMKMKAEEAQ